MAPKKRLNASERREQILECAKTVFAERGLAGARTRDIALACGINEALLYRHFASKEQLFRESSAHLYQESKRNWIAEALKCPTGLEGLQSLVRSEIIMLTQNPQVCANLLHGIASATMDEKSKDLAVRWFTEHHQVMIDLVNRGMEDGSCRKNLVPDRVSMFLRGIIWMNMIQVILGLQEDLPGLLVMVDDSIRQRLGEGQCSCPGNQNSKEIVNT
jgi:AcrR family transcriptional regulator